MEADARSPRPKGEAPALLRSGAGVATLCPIGPGTACPRATSILAEEMQEPVTPRSQGSLGRPRRSASFFCEQT